MDRSFSLSLLPMRGGGDGRVNQTKTKAIQHLQSRLLPCPCAPCHDESSVQDHYASVSGSQRNHLHTSMPPYQKHSGIYWDINPTHAPPRGKGEVVRCTVSLFVHSDPPEDKTGGGGVQVQVDRPKRHTLHVACHRGPYRMILDQIWCW